MEYYFDSEFSLFKKLKSNKEHILALAGMNFNISVSQIH